MSTFQCENRVYATVQKLEPVISMDRIFSVTGEQGWGMIPALPHCLLALAGYFSECLFHL